MANGVKETAAQELARIKAENEALRAKLASRAPGISFKVTEPRQAGTNGAQDKGSLGGAVAVYGLGRFPVTLYKSQWVRLLAEVPTLVEFLRVNNDKLAVKD